MKFFPIKVFFSLFVILFWAAVVSAQSGSFSNFNEESRLKNQEINSINHPNLVSDIKLTENCSITVLSDPKWSSISRSMIPVFNKIDKEYRKILGEYSNLKVTIKFMDSDEFYASTKAPTWTNAMYYKGQIIIPMNEKNALDLDNLYRSIRHEYTHAVVHQISGGKAPGWLDEGLAQLLEGSENPALKIAVAEWLVEKPVISFNLLQGGFTKLKTEMVAAAYGQSLYAVKSLIKNNGFRSIRKYLENLKIGFDREDSFQYAFKKAEVNFEEKLKEDFFRSF